MVLVKKILLLSLINVIGTYFVCVNLRGIYKLDVGVMLTF